MAAAVLVTLFAVGVPGRSTHREMRLVAGTGFTITGSVSHLAPGAPGQLTLLVTNPKTVAISVRHLAVTPGSPAPQSCAFTNLDLSQAVYDSATGFAVAPNNGTATHDFTISLKSTAPDSCQGVTFPLNYAGTAFYTLNTTTALASSQSSSTFGQAVTFTATVTASEPPPGSYTGNVTFKDGSTTLSTVAVTTSGTAQFTTSSLAVGSHPISAVFTPTDTNFTGSASNTVTQTVAPSGTQTTLVLSSSQNPSTYGNSITFTATISNLAKGAKPGGTVKFYDGGTSGTLLGTASMQPKGTANLSDLVLSVGSHPITAVYSGDTVFAGSTSNTVTLVVNKATRNVTLASSANPSKSNQQVTFTASLPTSTAPVANPTGTVTFFDGTTNLGTASLTSGAQATFSTSALATGSHSITARYNGDSNFNSATSAVLTQTVKK